LNEIDVLFSLSRNQASVTLSVPLPDPTVHGIRVTCKDLAVIHPRILPIFEHFNLEVTPGEKIGGYVSTAAAKKALARASYSSVEVFSPPS
jgi:putative ABC transport system ATP-binding protein